MHTNTGQKLFFQKCCQIQTTYIAFLTYFRKLVLMCDFAIFLFKAITVWIKISNATSEKDSAPMISVNFICPIWYRVSHFLFCFSNETKNKN